MCHGHLSGRLDDGAGFTRPVFASAVPPTSYATEISRRRYPAGTDPASLPRDAWSSAPAFRLGYQLDPQTGFPVTVVDLDGQSVSSFVALDVDDKDLLVLTLNLGAATSVICTSWPALYASLRITFSAFGDSFTGGVSSTCASREGTGSFLWRGEAASERLVGLTGPDGRVVGT
ncbi:hypothetical protein [Micromonospora sp. WMMD975]|uniref:hypothetical protein n=1 Tax=Micromonospora sp. WMMD975 TaxID=3016087 RepID=UPI00249B7436|nr:hypothetical protein [Micromonospora sp. WMMD975]WFE31240.1 hypothetical protein O7613_16530 [Micromonospora sp. WMMD975]